MEIEVGDFVRTYNGIIGTINKIEPIGKGLRYAGEYSSEEIIQINDGHVYERRLKRKDIVKHSKHIIDLIEVEDIVECMVAKFIENGTEKEETIKYEVVATVVLDINGNPTNEIGISGEKGVEFVPFENVRSILTHEQYEKNCYRLEE